jgi:beta-aspartyl-peptidase (threonine type)
VARDIAALMEYKGLSLNEAADMVVNKKLVEAGGEGGIIALDRNGNVAMPFNSAGMYRGYAKPGKREVGIYKE